MADNKSQGNNFYSENDALDINELASLNEDISPEFIEQLQNKVSQNADMLNNKDSAPINVNDDSTLFEEIPQKSNSQEQTQPPAESKEEVQPPKRIDIENNIDDNFIKKYKAKLNKQTEQANAEASAQAKAQSEPKAETKLTHPINAGKENKEIENLTSGNILEKPATKEQINYNESLDYLDDNVKYSKYVIYIDPENTDFMESLTVKERKNLINRILREQDDIAITKRRLGMVQAIIKHAIIAIVTIAIAIPVVYFTINASLEATINNYRRSQSIFQTLYKEHGKIKNTR